MSQRRQFIASGRESECWLAAIRAAASAKSGPGQHKAFGGRGLVTKGFTGTVTASNGVVYHYVDGKRVPGHQYQSHIQANPHAAPAPAPGQPGHGPQHRAAAKQAIDDAVNKLKTGSTTLTNQEIGDLVHHFQHLTLAEAQKVKVDLGLPKMRGMGGGKNLADHVAHILDHFITHPLTQGSTNVPAASPAPAPAPAAAQSPPAPPAAPAAAPPPAPAHPLVPNVSQIHAMGTGNPQAIVDLLHHYASQSSAALTLAVKNLHSSQSDAVAVHLGLQPSQASGGPPGRLFVDVDKDIEAAVAAGKGKPQAQAPAAPAPAPPSAPPHVAALNTVHNVLSDLRAGKTPAPADVAAAVAGLQHLTDFQLRNSAQFAGISSVTNASTRSEKIADVTAHLQGPGFTGTVTASNGVVYHYVNGVRVASPLPPPGSQSPGAVSTLLQKFQASGPLAGQDLTDLRAHLPHLIDADLDSVASHLGLGVNASQHPRAHVMAAIEAHMTGQPAPQVSSVQAVQQAFALASKVSYLGPSSLTPAEIQVFKSQLHAMTPLQLGNIAVVLGLPYGSALSAIVAAATPPPTPMDRVLDAIKGTHPSGTGPAAHQDAMDAVHSVKGTNLDQLKTLLNLPSSAGLAEVTAALADQLKFHGITKDPAGNVLAFVHGQPLVLKTTNATLIPIIQKVMTGQLVSRAEQAAFDAAVLTLPRKELDAAIADMGLPAIPAGSGGRTSALKNALAAHTGHRPSPNPANVTPPSPPAANMAPAPSNLGPTPVPPLAPAGPPVYGGPLPKNVSGKPHDRSKLEALVRDWLKNNNTTADNQLGNGASVRRAIAANLSSRSMPTVFDVDRAITAIHCLDATTVIPPKFLGQTSRNGPNHSLPSEARPAISTDQKVACQKYTVNSAAYALNDGLRTTGKPPAEFADMHKELQTAFANTEEFATPVDCVRGLDLTAAVKANLVALAQAAMASGGALMMPGYTSTTVGHRPLGFFSGNVVLKIKATHGLDLDPYSHYPGTGELLLNHASQFKVTNIVAGGTTEIHLEQIPPTKTAAMPAHDQAPAGVTAWAKGVWAGKSRRAKAAPGAPLAAGTFKSFASVSDCQAVMDFAQGRSRHHIHSNRPGMGEDTMLTAIMDENGKSGLPTVHDQAGIDALKAQGWTIGYRGVSNGRETNQFRKNPAMFNGSGMYGNGTYTHFAHGGVPMKGKSHIDEHQAKRQAFGYGSSVMRIAIPPTAKVVTVATINKKRTAIHAKLAAEVAAGKITHAESRKIHDVIEDHGRLASLLGYDVINCGGRSPNYCVILNRAIVAVQDHDI